MAPNIPITSPIEETLNPVRLSTEDFPGGTHKFSSTYAKKEARIDAVHLPQDSNEFVFFGRENDFELSNKPLPIIDENHQITNQKPVRDDASFEILEDELLGELDQNAIPNLYDPSLYSEATASSPTAVDTTVLAAPKRLLKASIPQVIQVDPDASRTPLHTNSRSNDEANLRPLQQPNFKSISTTKDDNGNGYKELEDRLISLERLFIEEISRDSSNTFRIVLREQPSILSEQPSAEPSGKAITSRSSDNERGQILKKEGPAEPFEKDVPAASSSKDIKNRWINHRNFPSPTVVPVTKVAKGLRASEVATSASPEGTSRRKSNHPTREGRKMTGVFSSSTTSEFVPNVSGGETTSTTTTISPIHKAEFSDLHHHEKSYEELAKNVKEVSVKEGSGFFSSEATTVVILGGMAVIIMMLICFLFVVTKWKKRRKRDKLDEYDAKEQIKPETEIRRISTSLAPTVSFLSTPPTSKSSITLSSFLNLEDLGKEEELGHLWFSLRYDKEKSDLHLNILHARYPNGRGISNNPGEVWVEARIITPMNKVKTTSKTTPRKATQAPVFNHSISFLLEEEGLTECILKLILYDMHPRKGQQMAGSVILPLSSIDIHSYRIYSRDLL